jgi:hypothetical protein
MPARLPGRGGWKHRINAAFTENLALKASAALLALVLWFVVAAREPTEEVVGVHFSPVLDTSLVLRDPPPSIRALVLGRASEILKLSTNPLTIRRPVSGDVPDTLVLTLHASDVDVPEGVEVIVRDIEPRAITLRFEETATRVVPVRSLLVQGRPGLPSARPQLALVHLDPDSVTIAGPRRAVTRVRYVETAADTIAGTDTIPHLVDLDTANLGVAVKPPQVKAALIGVLPRPVRTPPAVRAPTAARPRP